MASGSVALSSAPSKRKYAACVGPKPTTFASMTST
jgi:hypothetical protein